MPAPTSWWVDSEPERAAVAADGVRLAVTAVLQALPPRQRGVFILRDVLGHSAAETAAVLELSVTAVNSALQRARAAVRDRASRPARLRPETVEHYARAIERADVAALAALVAADVVFEMPPVPQWSTGRETYAAFMAHLFAWRGTRWATRPISANGQPGILLSLLTDAGQQPHTVQLFEADAAGAAIGHVLVYQEPRLFAGVFPVRAEHLGVLLDAVARARRLVRAGAQRGGQGRGDPLGSRPRPVAELAGGQRRRARLGA